MKKGIIAVVGMTFILSLTGCGFSTFSINSKGAEQEVTIPNNALVVSDELEETISFGEKKINIPRSYSVGKCDHSENYTLYGMWAEQKEKIVDETVEPLPEYKLPYDNDIVFYMVHGKDKTTPDVVLSRDAVKSSFFTYSDYLQSTLSLSSVSMDSLDRNDADGNFIGDENGNAVLRTSTDEKWYYTTFISRSGEAIYTTYNTSCYPKTYYGIIMLSVEQNADYSRDYYAFIFSNDARGNLMTNDDYDSLFEQLKSEFCLKDFYTEYQRPSEYNPKYNYYNGRSYEQFEALMQDTRNYYILKESTRTSSEGAAESSSSEAVTPND